MVSIPGYVTVCRLDKESVKGVGGGNIILARESIKVLPIPTHEFSSVASFMQITKCCLVSGELSLYIYNCYRSPAPTYEEESLQLLCEVYSKAEKNSIILGDINLPEVDFQNYKTAPYPGTCQNRSATFVETFCENGFIQMVEEPTRIPIASRFVAGDYKHIPVHDVLTTNEENLVQNISVSEGIGKSDHCCVTFHINVCTKQTSSQLIPNYGRANWEGFRRHLEDFSSMFFMNFLQAPASECNDALVKAIKEAEQLHVPFVKKNSRGRQKWMSKNLSKVCKAKHQSFLTYKKRGTEKDRLEYVKLTKKVKRECLKARKKLEKSLARGFKGNSKALYSYISSRSKVKSNIGPLQSDVDGRRICISDDQAMANELNKYFSSVFVVDSEEVALPKVNRLHHAPGIEYVDFSTDNVLRAIDTFKSNTSCGPDGISARILKEFKDIIAPILSNILRKTICRGDNLPDTWRQSNIAAIHKKSSKTLASNYRPVAMECLFVKVGEKIVKNHLIQYVSQHQLLHRSQHGFVPKKSTLTNLIEYWDIVTKALDQGHSVSVIYTDYSKMFDRISHRLLLHKLSQRYGIAGALLNWISDWLTNRTQKVVINGVSSVWCKVTSSIMQGSCLGPILALLMSDDIDEQICHSFLLKFADDNKCFKIITDPTDYTLLQTDLNSIWKWAQEWGFDLNVQKCAVMHFGNAKPMPMFINDQELSVNTCERDLGVYVSSNAKWDNHIQYAIKKAWRAAHAINRAFVSKDPTTWASLFKVYVRPHLEYCLGAWIPRFEKDFNALYTVQRWFTRQCPGIGSMSHEERDELLGLPSISKRLEEVIGKEVLKIKLGISGIDRNVLTYSEHDYPTRNSQAGNPSHLKPRIDARKFSFAGQAPLVWERLPQEVKMSESVYDFKVNLRKSKDTIPLL